MEAKIKLLLAEDEPALAQIIQESLQTRGFEVTRCADGEQAFEAFAREKPDVMVLDVMMPKKDGFSVAQDVRKIDKFLPIVFLTAKSQTQDVVTGFHLGGNDYLKKPFSMEELIVRIHALLGRRPKENSPALQNVGRYQFDAVKQTLQLGNHAAVLTHREAALLMLLIENKNEIVDRSLILKKIWGNDDFFNGRSLDVFITKLRKKLSHDPAIQIINIRSHGYKLIE